VVLHSSGERLLIVAVAFGSIASSVPASSATSVTVTCPSSTTTGDLLLFFAGNSHPTTWGTVPTGYTLVTKPGSTSTHLASACWYKIADGSDVAASTTYTATCGGTAGPVVGVIVNYTSEDGTQFPLASTKLALAHGTSAVSTSPVPTNPSLINSTDLVVRAYVAGFSVSGTGRTLGSAPSGWTQRGSGSTGPTNISSNFQVGMIVCDNLAGADSLTTTSSSTAYWDIYDIAIPTAPPPSGMHFMNFFFR
jgi:hypothetical protein